MSAPNCPRPGLHALIGPGLMAASIRGAATAETRPLILLSFRALVALGAELGGPEAAARYLFNLANEVGRPIAINAPEPDGSSRTHFYAPWGWSDERLRGFIGGFADEIEATFGEVATIRRGER